MQISDPCAQMWAKCQEIIKDNIDADQYEAWFAPVTAVSFIDDRLTLRLPSQFFVEQIERVYLSLVSSTLKRVFGPQVKLFYTYDIVSSPGTTVRQRAEHDSTAVGGRLATQTQQPANPFKKPVLADIDPQLNSRYNFENYCEGDSNKLAVTIAKTIAKDPKCKTFNPLFVFGSTGVGKTHLIQAIGVKLKENYPHLRVLYLTAPIFERQYSAATLQNKSNDFISFYQSIDVLILDDIQEFAGKQKTQNTFYHIFNHLHQNQKQLIMSSDRRPVDMDGMVPRLISRFKWGMTVELAKPDYELRCQVLRSKAERDGVELPDDVVAFIAKNVTDSIRDLEGVVVSLLAHATMLNQDISLDLARSVLGNIVKLDKPELTFEAISAVVAEFYNIDEKLFYSKTRKRDVSDARQMLMYIAKRQTCLSSTIIGQKLYRDHATVLHACKQVEQRLSIDKKLCRELNQIEDQLAI